MGKTFWGVVSAAVEQSRRKANMVAQGDGKFLTPHKSCMIIETPLWLKGKDFSQ